MIFSISTIVQLVSLNILNIQASLPLPVSTDIEPDYKINIKVPANLPDPHMDFYTALENLKSKEHINHFEGIRKDLIKLCTDTRKVLVLEHRTIVKISNELNLDSSAEEVPLEIIDAEYDEWEIRGKIIENKFTSHDFVLNNGNNELESLKEKAMYWLELPAIKGCTKDLESYFTNRLDYKNMINDIKTWLLAQQMIKGPNQIPAEFIRPDWKPLFDHLNLPKDSFMIAPIKTNMNLHYLMNVAGKDFENSIKILKIEMIRIWFISRKQPKEIRTILSLRKTMLKIVLAEPVSLETISIRVKAFERLAESVVRRKQVNRPLKDHVVTVFIKLWLLSRQVFTENGWNENIYGFITESALTPKAAELKCSLTFNPAEKSHETVAYKAETSVPEAFKSSSYSPAETDTAPEARKMQSKGITGAINKWNLFRKK